MGSSDELMTDDDFEKLLDELEEQKAEGATANAQPAEDDAAGAEEVPGPNSSAEDNEIAVMLDPSVMIGQANEMHERLCSLLDAQTTVVLQAAEVNVIDTANMQLLFAFARDRRDKELETKIQNPSESFINTANCLGMINVLAVETATESLA